MRVLRAIVEACPDVPVMIDSGFRRGTDVLKALALGAQFVFVGRPFNYAAAVGGEDGVRKGISLLREEISRDLAMLGGELLEAVAHVGPRDLAADLDLETLALIGAKLLGQHDGCAVDDRDEPDFDLRSLQVGHAVRTPQTKTASRSAGRIPTAQDAVVQATDRLWSVLNSERTRHWAHTGRWSSKHANHAAAQ